MIGHTVLRRTKAAGASRRWAPSGLARPSGLAVDGQALNRKLTKAWTGWPKHRLSSWSIATRGPEMCHPS